MKAALIIFVRNPVLGQVKTRIAKDIGNEAALHVYRKLLKHTHSITRNLNVGVFVFYTEFVDEADLWTEAIYKKRLQTGRDLGERMKNAFTSFIKEGYQKICIIGSDCFDLNSQIIEEAFDSLGSYDFVLGPSKDGGYYLLGMNKFLPKVFENKKWSSESVYTDTIDDIVNLKSSYYVLPTLSDVDTVEDCRKYESLLSLTL